MSNIGDFDFLPWSAIMLSKAMHFCILKYKLHPFKNKLQPFKRFYCSDKVKHLQEINLKKDKKNELLQESQDIIAQNCEDCAKFEEQVLKQVLIEKEKDASLRSRLSKECKTLFNTPANKLGAGKCGPLHLDPVTLQNGPDGPVWGTYSFNHLETKLAAKSEITNKNPQTERISVPVKSEGIPSKTKDPGGGSGGGVVAANRPVRQEPGKVLFCFIPEEFWRIFIPKTGVTGFGTFLFTISMFLLSKEIYVLEHNYYHGISALIMWVGGVKYIGPHVTKMLDKEVDQYEKEWNQGRVNEKKSLEDNTVHELFIQFQSEGQLILLDAKRENVKLQLEEEFRKRQMMAYREVKQRLDYHVALERVKERMQQKNLVDYVTREVKKAITPEMQDKLIYYSIDRIVHDLNQGKK